MAHKSPAETATGARDGAAIPAPAGAPSPSPSPSRTRRVLRALGWTLGGLVVLLLALLATGWWWIGTDSSLATALTRAARYLPPDQSLESREVSGSLRHGGTIGHLRWQSPTMAVEVQGARIGWALRPLLRKRVELGEVHAARITIEPRGPKSDKPVEPLAGIELPIDVVLPFRVDALEWKGPPAVQATALAGRYGYEAGVHTLDLKSLDLAEGHYSGRVQLQGAAPMALELALDGTVQAPLDEGRHVVLKAKANAQGTLAGADARLTVHATAAPEEQPDAAQPVDAQLDAQLAPWAPQPVVDARLQMRNLDAAWLLPTAPRTRLTGEVAVEPDPAAGANAWKARADVTNAEPGPWDKERLPVESLQARVAYDGQVWRIADATVRAGGGRIEAEGEWRPSPAPWQARATVTGVRPGELHTQLAGAPVSGRATATQKDDALDFDVALQAQGGAGSAALKGFGLDRALAQGQWKDQVLDLRTLRIEAQRASVAGTLQLRVAEQAGSGNLKLVLPGGGAELQGRLTPTQGGGELKARVDDAATLQRWVEALPGLSKAFGGAGAQGSARLDARWQGGWQAVQRRLQNTGEPAPRGSTEPTLQATLTAPKLDLRLPPPAATSGSTSGSTAGVATAGTTVQLRNLRAELGGSLAQATLSLQGEASTGTQKITLDTRASGGLERANQWRAALASLRVQAQDSTRPGPWTLELSKPVTATVRSGANRLEVEASAAGATVRGPAPGTVRIDWQPLRFSQSAAASGPAYRLQSKGTLQGLPMAWAEALGASSALTEAGVSGDLLFDGDWDIEAGDTLRARARLARQSGDIRVQAGEAALVTRIESHGTGTASERTLTSSSGAGASNSGTPAGLRQAELKLDAQGDAVKATLAWDSARAGQVNAEASTRVLQQGGGWQWAPDAPLAGRVSARLPSLGVWSMLAPPGWRIAGTLDADATLSGNRAAPRWNGTLGADQLALRAAVEGLDLRDGRLRATLSGDRIEITEFALQGGAGSSTRIGGQSGNRSTAASEAANDGGRLSATGSLRWGAAPAAGAGAAGAPGSGIRMDLQAKLARLRVLVRSDRQVTLSGDLQAKLDNGQFTVRGKLKTDRAVIILPDETAPSLGSDVVVHSAAKDREAAAAAEKARKQTASDDAKVNQPHTAKPPDIAVVFDLGDDFAVQGRGITTRLEGQLDIRSTALNAPPRITGEVKTVQGRYRAYGQELDVESGIARFSGPFDNPQLDILAIRPNISQRAGVQITGSAYAPRVKLYSEPALSDAETLSWVILGRAQATSGGESALLQQAALAMLGGLGKGGSGASLASRFGLDEIGFKGPGSGGDLRESAVTLGKRLSKDFYVTYERSLGGTFGTLFIFYDLTRRLTLRGQAGMQSGLDLIYTVKYD